MSYSTFLFQQRQKKPAKAIAYGLLLVLSLLPSIAYSEPTLLRIGTGGSEGTYFPIGTLIAEAVTGTIDTQSPEQEPDLIAIAQRATGSASNVDDLNAGLLEGALAQADIVHWAFNGTGPFSAEVARDNIRGLATLYLESMHLVVRAGSDINSIYDLEGRRVSLDEQGSGTRLDSLVLLEEFGLTSDNVSIVYLKTSDAIDRMQDDELDAFFVIAGYPIELVSQLVSEGLATVIPITGPLVEKIIEEYPFFSRDSIPAGIYKNDDQLQTIGVPAQLILHKALDEELVYKLTSRLWQKETLTHLSNGHPKGADVKLESALTGMGIPLHPGAWRYYLEKGIAK